VVPFHWLVRDSRRDNLDSSKGPASFEGSAHAPVLRVHGDYTASNAPLRFAELQQRGMLDASWTPDTKSWAIVNVWRSIGDAPIASKPLALLDASTVADARNDVFPYALVADEVGLVGYNNSIAYDARHRWVYFPQMNKNEALVFFTYDSDAGKRQVFHTAVDVEAPSTAAPAPRHSVEVRSLVVFRD